uniref:Beta-defensin-like domain-containing protein n=1 Tax=Lynx canadensis TaxID=61383 RepID=A0A667FGA7_LYNCA
PLLLSSPPFLPLLLSLSFLLSALRVPENPGKSLPGQGTNGSRLLHHQEKRHILPRTPPYEEPEPDFKVVNCKKSEGYCQEYCNYMETQVGYCFKKKYACCLHQN